MLVVWLNFEGNARVAVMDDAICTDTVLTGLPDAKATATGDVLIKRSGGLTKSIEVAGSRTTVSSKPGVAVDGITIEFVAGATKKPWMKFPGQTEYTLFGSARYHGHG